MTLERLSELITGDDTDALLSLLETNLLIKNIEDSIKQYEPKTHAVYDLTKRKNKSIKDEAGNITDSILVTRLPLPIQKKIVLTAAAFLGTPSIDASPEGDVQDNMITVLKKTCDDNKLNYKFKTLAKIVMSEKQCAELWFTRDAEPDHWTDFPITSKFKLGVKLLAFSLGDTLYPVFDDYGDMIAFARGYKIKDEKGNDVQHFDVYMADKIYMGRKGAAGWEFWNGKQYQTGYRAGITNPIGKIPVIYYSQPLTEWEDVQPLIERLETKISNHADTNDYFDSPIVFAEGDVQGFADKGESGKVLTGKQGAKVSYLTWDQAPESTRMEIENLNEWIYKYTNTPDVSFNNLKNLGYFSTIALKTMFTDAHLKASDKEEIFGEGVQRRYNYLKKALAVISGGSLNKALVMDIKPKFEYFLPANVQELITTLVQAVQGGILSKETAVSLNTLVTDPVTEMERIGVTTPGQGGAVPVVDSLGKIPLALQQLSLAATRAVESGDTLLADRLNLKINELLATI
jgi:SPP1 family phage portal protein